MRKKPEQEQNTRPVSASPLERDLAGLIDNSGTTELLALMQQMAALEPKAPQFYITSRPACNCD